MSDGDGDDMDVLNDLMSVRSGRYLHYRRRCDVCSCALPG